jgi:hypothetical protein
MNLHMHIQPQFIPRRGQSASVRKTNGRMMYMEIFAVTFENAQEHINALRGQIMYSNVILKPAVCTATVRVFNDNYSSLTLSCIK